MNGLVVAILGLALCMILCGIGSAIGLYKAGSAASGVLGEDGKKFSKVIILAILPASQGLYGSVAAIIGLGKLSAEMSMATGLAVLGAGLPIAIVGMLSAIFQGNTAVSAINAVAKDDSISGKMILFPAMVETYALLALVITLMLFGTI